MTLHFVETGKRALDIEKFCTNCGNPIVEAKLVVDEVSQIIKVFVW